MRCILLAWSTYGYHFRPHCNRVSKFCSVRCNRARQGLKAIMLAPVGSSVKVAKVRRVFRLLLALSIQPTHSSQVRCEDEKVRHWLNISQATHSEERSRFSTTHSTDDMCTDGSKPA